MLFVSMPYFVKIMAYASTADTESLCSFVLEMKLTQQRVISYSCAESLCLNHIPPKFVIILFVRNSE